MLYTARAVSGLISGRVVSVLHIPGLNLKLISSAYDVEANALLVVIRPSDGDVKPGCPLVLFEKIRLMPTSNYPFTDPHPIFITLTLHKTTTLTYTHSRHLLNLTVALQSAMWLAEVVPKLIMDHSSTSICLIVRPKYLYYSI
jgi:hypothetical protein